MKTYCNPLPLPNYPSGLWCRPAFINDDYGWMHAKRSHFRETADPTALWHDGLWYLYVSCGAVYTSPDLETWTHHPLPELADDYDPRVFAWGGKFYLTASRAPVWVGDTPLGPWAPLGRVFLPGNPDFTGKTSEQWGAPTYLHDDDGRLYAYWGIGQPGIFVAEADPKNPVRLLTEPKIIFGYDPAHIWERFGDYNEDPSTSYVEGPWVIKRNGRYFVIYSAPGTEWKTYALGYYYSDSPTGPFHYAEAHNPFILQTEGLVHGTGHGCVVTGPNDQWWCFYTCLVRSEHNFERRVGVDRLFFTEDNHIARVAVTSSPQFLDGRPSLVPVNTNRHARASSHLPGHEPVFANDHVQRTWWQPASGDTAPWLDINLAAPFTVSAVRLCWHEEGLDYDDPARLPTPVRWRLLGRADASASYSLLHDAAANTTDLLIDIRHFAPTQVSQVRLELLPASTGPAIGVTDFTVFGQPAPIQ